MSLPASDQNAVADNRTTMDLGEVLPKTAQVKDGQRFIGGVDMVELAQAQGTALYVYDEDALDILVDGEHTDSITMSNGDAISAMTSEQILELKRDISLHKVISANYGEGAWGMLSDRLNWSSDNADVVSVDYNQGGMYSDIRNYSYTSYIPTTDFLLVGKGKTEDKVTIRATHADTGITKEFKVTADTLENELYVFQFAPQTETHVVYTNGNGDRRDLVSNEKGELAVYEPSGIASTVMAMSGSGTETFVGTLYANKLISGERDIAARQLYPCRMDTCR